MTKSRLIITAVLIAVLPALRPIVTGHDSARASFASARLKGSPMSIQQQGRVRAPELTGGRGWLNTERPLQLSALRGKVVLLDFWTYGCINCIHILPDLKRLEEKYARELVVIGVHSAKFENERETDNIRRIILRYQIEHPVVNDADFAIWRSYAVRAWPTQILIDPAGYVIGKVQGEGNYEVIDRAISQTIEEFRRRGALNEHPLKLALERAKVGDLPLAFPGKVLADERAARLFIADSNHNRIVVTKLDGTLIDTIGTGEPGAADGTYAAATFYRPQGMALDGDDLYVADTENHLLRRVDLKARTVHTIAGTGRQAQGFERGAGLDTALNSPWDLVVADRMLYIAMAGPHQIWSYDLTTRETGPFAGSGREARLDGALSQSAFAQPSGLATDGKTLYVADSESNIIRAIDLRGEQRQVRTLAGGDLFEFGDVDGRGDGVRLQHPLGVVLAGDSLFIADTYNHKIKQLAVDKRAVRTFVGTGKSGQVDGAAPSFYEPGGISAANGKLYVADTNNHAVRVIDLRTKRTLTLPIRGLRPPAAALAAMDSSAAAAATGPNAEEFKLAPQQLSAGGDGAAVVIDVALPAGYHLNPSAPHRYKVSVEAGSEHLAADPATAARVDKELQLPLRLPLRPLKAGAARLRIQLTIYFCREDNTGTCQIKTFVWHAPVEVTAAAAAAAAVAAPQEIRINGRVKA